MSSEDMKRIIILFLAGISLNFTGNIQAQTKAKAVAKQVKEEILPLDTAIKTGSAFRA